MREQLNFSSRETRTPLEDGDRIDTHVSNPELMTYEELEQRRRRTAFEHEALQRMDEQNAATPERAPMTPYEQLGTIGVNLARLREGAVRGDYDLAA